jgi:hypothetical protein
VSRNWQPKPLDSKRPSASRSVRTAAAAAAATLALDCVALEGGQAAAPLHFGVVGSIAPSRNAIGYGFPGVQIAPMWVLTAAHVAPPAGAIFANDYGMSGVSEVLILSTRAPTVSPVPGALRDDLALVRLASSILSPYFPRLADEDYLPHGPWLINQATLVSNNPSLKRRRYGVAAIELTPPVPGYSFALSVTDSVRIVSGDSGSPMFLGRLSDTDAFSILVGIASAQTSMPSGRHLGVYTRVGPYRELLDQAVQASGERLRWAEASNP